MIGFTDGERETEPWAALPMNYYFNSRPVRQNDCVRNKGCARVRSELCTGPV
jgi:hypothetical protein